MKPFIQEKNILKILLIICLFTSIHTTSMWANPPQELLTAVIFDDSESMKDPIVVIEKGNYIQTSKIEVARQTLHVWINNKIKANHKVTLSGLRHRRPEIKTAVIGEEHPAYWDRDSIVRQFPKDQWGKTVSYNDFSERIPAESIGENNITPLTLDVFQSLWDSFQFNATITPLADSLYEYGAAISKAHFPNTPQPAFRILFFTDAIGYFGAAEVCKSVEKLKNENLISTEDISIHIIHYFPEGIGLEDANGLVPDETLEDFKTILETQKSYSKTLKNCLKPFSDWVLVQSLEDLAEIEVLFLPTKENPFGTVFAELDADTDVVDVDISRVNLEEKLEDKTFFCGPNHTEVTLTKKQQDELKSTVTLQPHPYQNLKLYTAFSTPLFGGLHFSKEHPSSFLKLYQPQIGVPSSFSLSEIASFPLKNRTNFTNDQTRRITFNSPESRRGHSGVWLFENGQNLFIDETNFEQVEIQTSPFLDKVPFFPKLNASGDIVIANSLDMTFYMIWVSANDISVDQDSKTFRTKNFEHVQHLELNPSHVQLHPRHSLADAEMSVQRKYAYGFSGERKIDLLEIITQEGQEPLVEHFVYDLDTQNWNFMGTATDLIEFNKFLKDYYNRGNKMAPESTDNALELLNKGYRVKPDQNVIENSAWSTVSHPRAYDPTLYSLCLLNQDGTYELILAEFPIPSKGEVVSNIQLNITLYPLEIFGFENAPYLLMFTELKSSNEETRQSYYGYLPTNGYSVGD
jgi:hypothetical protein